MKKVILLIKTCLKILLLGTLFFVNKSSGQGVVLNPSSPFVVPPGVTSLKVECWGAGGNGGGATGSGFLNLTATGGGGGGGGAYSTAILPVNAGQSYIITYGAAGATGTGTGATGGFTRVTGTGGTVTANGGSGGIANNGAGGAGGVGALTTGTGITGAAILDGGKGGQGVAADGANGGGGAGNITKGNDGSSSSNTGTGGTGSPGNSVGGAGGNFITTVNDGSPGGIPGGGGGGARGSSTNTGNGGLGGAGQVIISYTCPAATIVYSTLPSDFCKSVTSAAPVITGSTGGTFSAIPATGLTIDPATGTINPSSSTAGTYTVHYQIAAANGCSAVDATASVIINPTPVSSATSTNITCNAAQDGTITVTASGGTGPYFFSDDNGSSFYPLSPNPGVANWTFTNLIPNTPYRIKVKDTNGCISK